MKRRVPALFAVVIIVPLLLSACGGSDSTATTPLPNAAAAAPVTVTTSMASGDPATATTAATKNAGEPTNTPAATRAAPEETPATAEPAATATAAPSANRVLTPDELRQYQPNELGEVPILMYHIIGTPEAQFARPPEEFRADLQWLYDHNFQVVPLRDLINDSINIPAGKKPVVLTFDDSSASQFRLLPQDNGQVAIDPQTAVGILEDFYATHPDFGRGGVFAIQSAFIFDWDPVTDESAQTQYAQLKLQWLLDNGYELGNHTVDHANLSEKTNDEIMQELADANDAILALAPGARIESIALPYGMYPPGGDDTLLRGFERNGKQYAWQAALQVGANPTVVPLSTQFDPYAMARIQTFDEELNKWFDVFVNEPGILYVSDGNPDTVTVPNALDPGLDGTLDESKLNGRRLIRY